MEYEVLKFGGSILKDPEAYRRVVDIVVEGLEQQKLPVCVLSAMKGVTDMIIDAVEKSHSDPSFNPKDFVETLFEDHLKALPEHEDASPELEAEFEKLIHVLAYIRSSGELTDSVYAYAISRGEGFSCRILSQHLKAKNIKNRCFYGEELLVTDDNYKEAAVNLEETKTKVREILLPHLEKGIMPIIAGFAGRSESGRVTIFGRGGTDDTAVNVAYSLGVKRTVKYVGEEGIMTIDPQFLEDMEENHSDIYGRFDGMPDAEIIPYLSYVEASELLREGRTKVVHYKVLDPLMKGNIELQVKNFNKPESEGTVIGRMEETIYDSNTARPKALTYQRGLYGIRFLSTQSSTPTEVYAKVFKALNEKGVDVRYLSTSGYQISLLMPREDVGRALLALEALDVAVEVSPMKGSKGTFSVIGSEMRGMRGFFSKLTGILGKHGVNIEQATQPNSENIIRFSVDDKDIPLAVGALYNEFFKGGY
jgi:aspartate kinase